MIEMIIWIELKCYTFLQISNYKQTSNYQYQRMSQVKQSDKFKQPHKKIVSLNYCIKPKTLINTPLNRYDLTQFQSDIDSLEITDYFNYGFNSQTFSSYAKLSKRFAQIQEIERPNHHYDSNQNRQFRFNDDMPIDLGGFGPFLDKQLINFWEDKDFDLASSLMEYFVKFNICLAFNKNHSKPSLTSFIALMNKSEENQDYSLSNLIDNLAQKINQKYERMLNILREKQASTKRQSQEKPLVESANFYDKIFNKNKTKSEQSSKRHIKSIDQLSQDHLSLDSIRYSSISQSESEEDKDASKSIKSEKRSYQEQKQKKKSKKDKKDSRQIKRKRDRSQQKKGKKKKDTYYDDNQQKKNKSRGKRKSKKIKKHKNHKKHKKHGKKSSKKHKK